MHILEARGNDNKDKTKHIYKVQHKGRVREGGVKDMEIWPHNPSSPFQDQQNGHNIHTTSSPHLDQQSNALKGQSHINCNIYHFMAHHPNTATV